MASEKEQDFDTLKSYAKAQQDIILNKLCIALIEEYNTEENAIKFINEEFIHL